MQIVTTVAVDEDQGSRKIKYSQISHYGPKMRREIYWKCATVLLCTSVRCNLGWKHVLYTNDKKPVRFNGNDVRDFLKGLGVEIRGLSFNHFKIPIGLSKIFRNNFYKLDVLYDIASRENEYSIMLDSDCVLTKSINGIENRMKGDHILLLEIFKRKDFLQKAQGISMKDMGDIFKNIDPDYPVDCPLWFGGEFIAGHSKTLYPLIIEIKKVFDRTVLMSREQEIKFDCGTNILDNDEYLASFVYNLPGVSYHDAGDIVKRMWTGPDGNRSDEDLNYNIWHLAAEKHLGFPLLFEECINPDSDFWKIDLGEFNIYLGEYLGVPERKKHPAKSVSKVAFNVIKNTAKNLLPLNLYNSIRRIAGRGPIDLGNKKERMR